MLFGRLGWRCGGRVRACGRSVRDGGGVGECGVVAAEASAPGMAGEDGVGIEGGETGAASMGVVSGGQHRAGPHPRPSGQGPWRLAGRSGREQRTDRATEGVTGERYFGPASGGQPCRRGADRSVAADRQGEGGEDCGPGGGGGGVAGGGAGDAGDPGPDEFPRRRPGQPPCRACDECGRGRAGGLRGLVDARIIERQGGGA